MEKFDNRPTCVVEDCDNECRRLVTTYIGNIDELEARVPICAEHNQRIEDAYESG